MSEYREILARGLWADNPGLVRFLGICPLLAVSNTLVNGIGLGLATLAVLLTSNLLVSLLRRQIPDAVRLPALVLIIASLVTAVDLAAQAWFFDLWRALGIFIPLIVTNCVILARAESFALRQAPLPALVDGLAHGLGFFLVLATLGGLRELLGHGTLFAGADQLLGPSFTGAGITVFAQTSFDGFLLALLPPGAFIGLGLLIAVHTWVNLRRNSSDSSS